LHFLYGCGCSNSLALICTGFGGVILHKKIIIKRNIEYGGKIT
jgi:hypothetical protein